MQEKKQEYAKSKKRLKNTVLGMRKELILSLPSRVVVILCVDNHNYSCKRRERNK